MSARTRKWLRFRPVVCTLALLGALAVAGAPLAQEAWARVTWRNVPCSATPANRFFYEIDGNRYASTRIDFWVAMYHTDPVMTGATAIDDPPNATCWVSPHDPTNAVLRLDAWRNLSAGASHFAAAAIVLAGGALVAFFGDRKPKRPAP